jgi:hypothetical protein
LASATNGTATLDFGTIAATSQTSVIGTTTDAVDVWGDQCVLAKVNGNAILPAGLILEAYIVPNQDHQIAFRISNITASPIVVGSLTLFYQVVNR